MNIGAAARQTGLPEKTIRYYEQVRLIGPAVRADNGYRNYGDRDLHIMRFIRRARWLGFTLKECRDLLGLYEDTGRASAEVKAMTLGRIADIDRRLEELHGLRNTLSELADKCHGDARPDCPILDDLAGKT